MATQYQSFPDARGASKSVAKLNALRLPDLDGKAFLDIGCNEGFFCAVARHAGAARVVGIDTNEAYLARARQRFPDITFRRQSWDDPIDGRFDVILFASAIHYAKDQPALVRKLMATLAPGGVLVLELGILQEDGDQYVRVRRHRGGTPAFATPAALRRELDEFDLREMGPSVDQRGDPVPRFVLHIRARPDSGSDGAHGSGAGTSRRSIVMFDAASGSGKSAAVRQLLRMGDAGICAPLFIDGELSRISGIDPSTFPAHAPVLQAIGAFRRDRATRSDLCVAMLVERGLLDAFLDYLAAVGSLGSASLTLWNGYLPPEAREPVRLYLERHGYEIWNTGARRRFRPEKQALATAPSAAAATTADSEGAADDFAHLDSAELVLVRAAALRAAQIAGKSIGVFAIDDAELRAALLRSGAADVVDVVAGTAPAEPLDVLIGSSHGRSKEQLGELLAVLLRDLAPRGLLALQVPEDPDSGRLPPAGAGTVPLPWQTAEPLVAHLRRKLGGFLVRKVVSARRHALGLLRVLHLHRYQPIVLFVDARSAAPAACLVRRLAGETRHDANAGPTLDVETLVARLDTAQPLPDGDLLLCHGQVDPGRRASIQAQLEDQGHVLWETWRRGKYAYRPLDVPQALERAFPDSAAAAPAAPSLPARAVPPVSSAPRVDAAARPRFPALLDDAARFARNLWRKTGGPRRAKSPVTGATGPAPTAASAAAAAIKGVLQRGQCTAEGLSLSGWAADTRAAQAVQEFVVMVAGTQVSTGAVRYHDKARVNQRIGLAADVRLGFEIRIPYAELGGKAEFAALCAGVDDWDSLLRLGCKGGDTVHWLRIGPGFELRPGTN